MLCAKQLVIYIRIVSSIYLQNIKVGQLLEHELSALLQMANCFLYLRFVTCLCAYGVLIRLSVMLVKLIYKTMCLRRMSSLGFFCTLLIIIFMIAVKLKFVQTCLVQQLLFRYRLWAICCEFKKCQCFVLMHISMYELYYIFLEEMQPKT